MKKYLPLLLCMPLLLHASLSQQADIKLQEIRAAVQNAQTSQEIVQAYTNGCNNFNSLLGSRFFMKQIYLLAVSLDAANTKNASQISDTEYQTIQAKIEQSRDTGGTTEQKAFIDTTLDRLMATVPRSVPTTDVDASHLQQDLETCSASLIADQATMRQLESTIQTQEGIIDSLQQQIAGKTTTCPDLQTLIKESRKNTILRNSICTTLSNIDETTPSITDSTYTECSDVIEKVRKPLRDASQLLTQLEQKTYLTDLTILKDENSHLFSNLQDGLRFSPEKKSCVINLNQLKEIVQGTLPPC
ncbi:hypothetical protein JW872_01510 [Candidatus Babeliales bacterium]|nr:hypothetical protein [Candidatus Babeliales bacterium]